MIGLGRVLDSESVRPYQALIYVMCIVSGAQTVVTGLPPNVVTEAMGHIVAVTWAVMLIACPTATLVGLWLSKKGWPSGLWMQVAGDAGVAWAIAAYAAAIFQATWAEAASFAAWLAIGVGVCALGMVIRDVRRIRQAGRLMTRMEHTGDN